MIRRPDAEALTLAVLSGRGGNLERRTETQRHCWGLQDDHPDETGSRTGRFIGGCTWAVEGIPECRGASRSGYARRRLQLRRHRSRSWHRRPCRQENQTRKIGAFRTINPVLSRSLISALVSVAGLIVDARDGGYLRTSIALLFWSVLAVTGRYWLDSRSSPSSSIADCWSLNHNGPATAPVVTEQDWDTAFNRSAPEGDRAGAATDRSQRREGGGRARQVSEGEPGARTTAGPTRSSGRSRRMPRWREQLRTTGGESGDIDQKEIRASLCTALPAAERKCLQSRKCAGRWKKTLWPNRLPGSAGEYERFSFAEFIAQGLLIAMRG